MGGGSWQLFRQERRRGQPAARFLEPRRVPSSGIPVWEDAALVRPRKTNPKEGAVSRSRVGREARGSMEA